MPLCYAPSDMFPVQPLPALSLGSDLKNSVTKKQKYPPLSLVNVICFADLKKDFVFQLGK